MYQKLKSSPAFTSKLNLFLEIDNGPAYICAKQHWLAGAYSLLKCWHSRFDRLERENMQESMDIGYIGLSETFKLESSTCDHFALFLAFHKSTPFLQMNGELCIVFLHM